MTKELSFEKEICLNYDIPFEYMDRIVKKNYERGKKDGTQNLLNYIQSKIEDLEHNCVNREDKGFLKALESIEYHLEELMKDE